MKTKVIFRADASPKIGYGHFIRSLALADMLKNDFDVRFTTVNPNAYQLEEMKHVCPHLALNRETHFEDFLALLKGDEIVVLDNYFFSTDYQIAIKSKGCRLVCIDDKHDKHYVADIVINHGINNPALFSIEPYTRLCIGLEWALLRKPFREVISNNRPQKPNPENIVISFGGADPHCMTAKFINIVQSWSSVKKIDAIVGVNFSENISTVVPTYYHKAVSAEKVKSLFMECDLAILSTSTICIEALACKTTIAAGYYVDNQMEFSDYLAKENLIIPLDNLLDEVSFDKSHAVSFNAIDYSNLKTKYIEIFNSLCSK